MAGEKQSPKTAYIVASIAAASLIVAAIIGGVFTYVSSRDGDAPNPPPNQASQPPKPAPDLPLVFETIEAIPQHVNAKWGGEYDTGPGLSQPVPPSPLNDLEEPLGDKEISTYRILLKNNGKSPLSITKGEYLVDSVTTAWATRSTAAQFTLMDHDGHIETPVKLPRVGDPLAFAVNVTIAPDTCREVTVWFRGIDRDAPEILYLTGRLRMYGNNSSITSHAVKLELHRETQYMLKARPD